jgi:flagellar biogenesis protein FliO
VLALPALALACPVCGTPTNSATRDAYVGSTIFLSLLPLSLIFGLIGWAVWRVRKLERQRQAELAAELPAE